jgi:tetratricopeptide (TPR) repeat protein
LKAAENILVILHTRLAQGRLYLLLGAVTILMSVMAAAENLPDFDSLWNYDKPAETEKQFREILPLVQKSGDIGYMAELLTQIARTLGLQQRFQEAHALLDSVQPMLEEAGPRAKVRHLLERGRAYNSSGQKENAVEQFNQALQLSSQEKLDFYAVDAAHMLAIATPSPEHQGWNLKAIALAEASSDPKARNWLGSLYNNLGWDFFFKKDYGEALKLFEKALEHRQQQGKPAFILSARWCVAKTLRMLGKVDSALAMQFELEKKWEKAGEQDGFVYEEIAECLLSLKLEKEATKYFALAHQYLSKDPWLSRDEPERLERLRKLGQTK